MIVSNVTKTVPEGTRLEGEEREEEGEGRKEGERRGEEEEGRGIPFFLKDFLF